MCRYYVDASGAQKQYSVGTGAVYVGGPPPLTPTTSGGGALTLLGVYKYAIASVDERGREGQLVTVDINNADLTATLSGTQNAIILGALGASGNATTVNVYRTVANGATYLFNSNRTVAGWPWTDSLADSALGDAAPEVGANDPPAIATFGAVYKDRLVLNNITAGTSPSNSPYLQTIQISNSDTPTQFSTITLPTDTSLGLSINCGTDTGDQVSGLANDGSLLAVFMRRSIKVLQGQDSTDFEVTEVHKRGGINHDSLARCENVLPFLSADGVYEMAYNNAFLLRKISLDIEDFFFGDADTVGNGNESDLVKRIMAASTTGSLFGWYFENWYFLSMPMETLVYDMVAQGWSQTGYGLISSACVYAQSGAPDSCFVLKRTNSSVKPRIVYWFSQEQEYDDPDALPSNDSTEITRLFDGNGPASERIKKLIRFSLWGDSAMPDGTVLGDLTAYTDQGFVSPAYPIVKNQVITERSAIFEQEFPDEATGRHIWFKIHITDPSTVLSDRMAQYSSYDVNG